MVNGLAFLNSIVACIVGTIKADSIWKKMNNAVDVMLERYNCKSINDYENALKEIIQEIALAIKGAEWTQSTLKSVAKYTAKGIKCPLP